ncbi:MAG TPA: hypothetical protein DEF78_01610 [Sphingobacterium sp.]|nr:hypothetical protein [Sphingobacterium sp.]
MDQTNHTLIIEGIQKSTYVWFEENWIHDDELHSHRKGQLIYVEQGFQYLTVAGKCTYSPKITLLGFLQVHYIRPTPTRNALSL